MAVTLNAKGTSVPYFKIGKGGTTIYQGTDDPSLLYSPIQNDVWIDTANNSVRYRTASNTWTNAGATIVTGATPSPNPIYGELWFDDGDTGKIYIWLGNAWVDTSPTPTSAIDVSDINDISLTSLLDGQVLSYDSANSVWVNTTTSSALSDTDGLTEGLTNLYFTEARVDAAIADSVATASLQLTGGVGNQGLMTWNADEETVDIVLNGATLQVGQETHIHVRNGTGVTIPNGTAVYVSGTVGNSGRLLVSPMIANNTIEARLFLGIATEDIEANGDGKITDFGKVRNIDTTAFAEGDVIWVSPTVVGGLTNVMPTAPNLKIPAGFVITSGTNGTIFVRVEHGNDLHNNHRVEVANLQQDDLLAWNASLTRWENHTYAQLGFNIANWDTAYSWGNHATAGYLTSFTETDPVFNASPAATITLGLIGQWNTAYGWGDHSLAGYLTTETYSTPTELLTALKTVDGIGSLLDADLLDGQDGSYYLNYNNLTNKPSIPVSSDDLSEGSTNLFYTTTRVTDDARTAISATGDISYNNLTGVISYTAPTNISAFTNDSGYLTSVTFGSLTDVTITTPTDGQVVTYNAASGIWENTSTNSSNWDTAYSWGDHSLVGYLTSETYSTPSELLTAIKTVDGPASGLDADLWDGNQFASYLDQPVRTGDNVTFNNINANNVTVGGTLYSDDVTASNVTITGNLAVSGTVVTVNSETVTIADNIFLLNSNVTGAPTENAGLEIERGTDINVLFIWDEVNDRWTFGAEDVYTSGIANLGSVVTNFGSATGINLSSATTSHLPEGSNLYYTDARVDARIALNETNDYVDGVSFNSGDGVLTLTRTGALPDLTTNLDGRYQIAGSYDNYVSWTISDGSASEAIASGNTLKIVGAGASSSSYNAATNTLTISSTDTDTNTYLSGLAFNVTNGILTATLSDASTVTVDLDGRYSQTDTTYSSGSGLTLTGTTFSVNVNGGLEIDVNDDIIISDTTVTTGSYGSADSVATFDVNSKGQITSASNTQISITASQVSDFNDGVKAAMSQTHSGIYIVTASDETTNSGANLPISANTLGFNLAGKEIYMVYLNRLLLRPSEYTLDAGTGTITFQQGILAQNDEIEAVFYG